MDYQLENLGPETFQHLTQALLTKEFQNVQCFPVAQPDGGRDATSIMPGGDIILYQVKYVRKPLAEQDPHSWLVDILQGEAGKVAKLLPKGVKQFVLITNVPGTAHLGGGSIDKVTKILNDNIPCQASVWWRDDINRRLDNAWDIKWAYPQIMSGQDLMQDLLTNGISEYKERRTKTIKSFLVQQYLLDEEVKFKQVELQNKLLDLFIDVPLSLSTVNSKKRYLHNLFQRTASALLSKDEEFSPHEPKINAATALLNDVIQQNFPAIVLEGGPGQGKSTITQYIAQVHRIRLLEKNSELNKIDDIHSVGPVKLPIKIDLRDFATWLSKKHPFDFSEDAKVPDRWQKTLESFIVFLIGFQAENLDFNSTDFQAVAATSSLVLLFDGLDEVADIAQRKEVVDEIVRGIKKLQEITASLQTIVTSRPAAFANSPGMPVDTFAYFQLESLNRNLIDKYANNWIKARHLAGQEIADIKKTLRYKLNEPHVRELSRNPMQLAILLSLVMSRGASLPEKRTALYEQYIDLFFSRESEKSPIIREFRDLIIELHGYVAWILHSETQSKNSNGSISVDNLKKLLQNYLIREGRDEQIVDDLLNGMVERVVALVSRVEGTYEFEVQPLREYFAAKYLYDSATYSPPGREKSGSKPDIFDALARDFHWLNVARFFAGCYSKGELPSLIDRLQVLAESKDYNLLNHPRLLTATLLSDWVFTQNTKSVREAVDLITEGTGLRFFVASQKRQQNIDNVLKLSNDNGRKILVDKCFKIIEGNVPRDYAYDIIRIIFSNNSLDESLTRWNKITEDIDGLNLNKWLQYALRLGIISKMSVSTLVAYMQDVLHADERVRILLSAKRWDVLESMESLYCKAVNIILNSVNEATYYRNKKATHSIERFINCVNPARLISLINNLSTAKIAHFWTRTGFVTTESSDSSIPSPGYSIAHKCDKFSLAFEKLGEVPTLELSSSFEHWENIIQLSNEVCGESWNIHLLALFAASNRYIPYVGKDYTNLFDKNKSLCRRARYAVERSGSISWWGKSFDSIKTSTDAMFSLLIFCIWATPAVIKSLIPKFDEIIQSLSDDEWHLLFNSIEDYIWIGTGRRNSLKSKEIVDVLGSDVSERTIVSLGVKMDVETRNEFYRSRLTFYDGKDSIILDVCQHFAATSLITKGKHPDNYLSIIERGYKKGVLLRDFSAYRPTPHYNAPNRARDFSLEVARGVAAHPEDYPSTLLIAAEQICHAETALHLKTVGSVAKTEAWPFA